MPSRWRQQVIGGLPAVPPDLLAVVGLVAVLFAVTFGGAFLPVAIRGALRIITGLSFVLFVPGYALVSALFPGAGRRLPDDAPAVTDRGARSITGIERAALSVGASVVIVPLIGYLLNFTRWGIRQTPTVLAVGGFTLVAALVATYRRNDLPRHESFTVPYGTWVAAGRSTLFDPEDRTDIVLNVLLVMSLLLAVSSVGYAVAVPREDERFTELSLLADNTDDDLVADGYPRTFTEGEPRSLYVSVENQEHRRLQYTLLLAVQNVTVDGSRSQVHATERLRTSRVTLQHNETWQVNHTVAPTLTGDRLRLTYLLYRGETPATPTVHNAYRTVHLWVNVSAAPEGRVVSTPGDRARSRTVPVTGALGSGESPRHRDATVYQRASSPAGGYEGRHRMSTPQSESATMSIEAAPVSRQRGR